MDFSIILYIKYPGVPKKTWCETQMPLIMANSKDGQDQKDNKKCFRNIYTLLGAKFKITTYMYKALWIQNFVQGRTKQSNKSKSTLSWSNGKKARISESLDELKHWAQKSGLTLIFEHVNRKSIGIIYPKGQPLHQVWYWSSEGVKRYWADNTVGWEEWFDLDLWTKLAR